MNTAHSCCNEYSPSLLIMRIAIVVGCMHRMNITPYLHRREGDILIWPIACIHHNTESSMQIAQLPFALHIYLCGQSGCRLWDRSQERQSLFLSFSLFTNVFSGINRRLAGDQMSWSNETKNNHAEKGYQKMEKNRSDRRSSLRLSSRWSIVVVFADKPRHQTSPCGDQIASKKDAQDTILALDWTQY